MKTAQNNIFDKFSTNLRNALLAAVSAATDWRHSQAEPEHILYGLIQQKSSIGSELLSKAGCQEESIKMFALDQHSQNNLVVLPAKLPAVPDFSPAAMQTIIKASLLASQYGHKYVGTEHLLATLLKHDLPGLRALFKLHRLNVEDLHIQVTQVLRSTSKFPDLTDMFQPPDTKTDDRSAPQALEYFCTDLTSPNVQKKIDPVIGRSEEIDRMIHILSRRTKNNPLLVGDPGVGKTAIVEGLAKKIANHDVPDILMNKRIMSLDLGFVVAGTMYRGEFESRMKQIIDEVKKDSNIILFIDEIHTLIGAGGANGSMDAANLLKPALAKGDIRCIGATTYDEFRKHIESDAALERRFQPIIINEPSAEQTVAVLEGLRSNYEKYHRVSITDDAIAAAVRLSRRYIQDKFLPDKAIDLIDEAASKVKVKRKPDPLTRELRDVHQEIQRLDQTKRDAVNHERFNDAVRLKTQQEVLRAKRSQLEQKISQRPSQTEGQITARDIAQIVSRITGVPVNELIRDEQTALINLEALLSRRIIGQTEAVTSLAQFLRRSRAGLNHPNRPIGSFMFLGPSGVGKTELAKVLAEEVFGDPKSLIRIDMSEYNESFQASKLIGAPAGYVGYKEGGKLTDAVRRRPYSVVLFDEIEKAHSDIFNLLLQVLEDGQLTDATGKNVNFKNTVLILTSNIGIEELNRAAALGFGDSEKVPTALENFNEIKDRILASLKDSFRPEFLNRIDKIMVFQPLGKPELTRIAELQLQELAGRLQASHRINLEYASNVVAEIARLGSEPDQGARAIRRIIQDKIEHQLADAVLQHQIKPGLPVRLAKTAKGIIIRS
ncbi:MAG: ATP-dependent Clp protease ATP-binding subunit [Patescibacteria group bacterium]|jgi:ATP-dependent Clp protease ATP-binding subunit ClpC